MKSLLFSLVLGSTSLMGASLSPTTVCTRDLNPWFNASRCECKLETAQYRQELGKCVSGEVKPIAVRGYLHSNVVAIGGETTGFEFTAGELSLVEF